MVNQTKCLKQQKHCLFLDNAFAQKNKRFIKVFFLELSLVQQRLTLSLKEYE